MFEVHFENCNPKNIKSDPQSDLEKGYTSDTSTDTGTILALYLNLFNEMAALEMSKMVVSIKKKEKDKKRAKLISDEMQADQARGDEPTEAEQKQCK